MRAVGCPCPPNKTSAATKAYYSINNPIRTPKNNLKNNPKNNPINSLKRKIANRDGPTLLQVRAVVAHHDGVHVSLLRVESYHITVQYNRRLRGGRGPADRTIFSSVPVYWTMATFLLEI